MKKMLAVLSVVLITAAGLAFASGGKAHWGYTGHEGPAHWGELSEEYAICGTGKNQSPINLAGMIEAELEDISLDYKDVPYEVVNNGHAIKVNYSEGSTLEVDGVTFKLLQFHFHTPSENHIEGKSFPMEAHLVHADAEGNLAVISVMYEEGEANSLIGRITETMPEEAGKTVSDPNASVNVQDILPDGKDYYRFNGSLTTPPCTEGVRWLVLKDTVEVSTEQLEKMHEVMHTNNRPIQATYARPVLK